MSYPAFEMMLVPVLRLLVAGGDLTRKDLQSKLAKHFNLSKAEAQSSAFVKRLSWALTYLRVSAFAFVCPTKVWINKLGVEFLKKYPVQADRYDLIYESELFANYMEAIELNRVDGKYDQRVMEAIQLRKSRTTRQSPK
jgi:hypothetical protein